MKTPYYLISKEKLDENIAAFLCAFDSLWKNSVLGYSVKTNSLPWLLSYLRSRSAFAEVVSDEEYDLALSCGFDDTQILFNGPVKGERFFKRAIEKQAIINLDSKSDLSLLRRYPTGDPRKIGIRVNLPTEIFEPKDIGYEKDGFRFGFSDRGDLKTAIDTIREVYGDCRFGLHLHCNSITRSVNVYRAIARYAAELIRKYDMHPSFIDIGGGFFGGVEGKPKPLDYIGAVKEVLAPFVDTEETTLIVEPGSAVIGSAVDLYTTVIDVKDNGKARVVTTDGSRLHIDPLWSKTHYLYSVNAEKDRIPRQIICGYTCMDHDRIMTLENEREIDRGDIIVYHRVGAYSVTFSGMFIRRLPEVYVADGEKIIKVRTEAATESYIGLHSS